MTLNDIVNLLILNKNYNLVTIFLKTNCSTFLLHEEKF